MGEFITEDGFYLIVIFGIFMWGIAIFLFRRISVKHIESAIAKEGVFPLVCGNEKDGGTFKYSMVILANKTGTCSPIDDEFIFRHIRKKDRKLAWFYSISTVGMFILMLVHYVFFPL